MEKDPAAEEDHPSDKDNIHDDSDDVASISEETFITSSPADNCSDSSVTSPNNASNLSFINVNMDKLSPNDFEKESKSKMLCTHSLACSDCNDNILDKKFSPEHVNGTSLPGSHKLLKVNVDSDFDLSTSDESSSSQGYINDSVSRQSKSSPVSQPYICNFSIDEDDNLEICDVLEKGKEACNIQNNKNILLSDEQKKGEFDHKDVHESPNLKALAVMLDEVQCEIDKKCLITTELVKDETSTLYSDVNASRFSFKDTSLIASGLQLSANCDSHEEKPSTNLANLLKLNDNLSKYSCSNNNNNNNLSSSFSYFTRPPESSCHQQISSQTTLLHDISPGFTNVNTIFQSNNGKTKVSFSFPLNSELNFNFGVNDAFSNLPASKNSFQIQPNNTDTDKNNTGTSFVASSTSSCKTSSIGLFERQANIFKPLPNSQISSEPMFKISDSLNTLRSITSSIKCSVPSSNSQTAHTSENTNTPKNNRTDSLKPLSLDFKISCKTRSSVAQNNLESLDSKKTSPTFSFGSSTSFSGCNKNLFPITPTNTSTVLSSSNDVKNVQTFDSFKSTFGPYTGMFPAIPISQQSPRITKSTSTLKTPIIKPSKLDGISRTFGRPSFSLASSLDNTQTTTATTTCSGLFSSSSPLIGKCSAAPLFDTTNAKSLFGSSTNFPKEESSQESVHTLFYSKPLTSNGMSKSEASANEKPSVDLGCTLKQNEQLLLEYKTPLKPSQAETTGSLFVSNPFSSKTTPSTTGSLFVSNPFSSKIIPSASGSLFISHPFSSKTTPTSTGTGFNFGCSSTAVNFNFGSSSVTPDNSPFIFKHSEKGGRSRAKLYIRKTHNFAQDESHCINVPDIPKIPFRVLKDKEVCLKNGLGQIIELRYQCITTMPEYSSFSFEELRFQYDKYNNKLFLPTETCGSTMISKVTQTSETMLDHLIDIWKALECPVCLEIVTSPVHQCERGHHVCNSCWKKITSCPLCKRYKMQTRNYVAESMVEKLPLPCKYRVDGCMKTMPQKEKTAHEDECMFRTYCCLVHDCNKVNCFKDMVVHLKTAHGHLMTSNEGFQHPNSWTLTKHNFQKLVHAFEIQYWGLFFLCHKTSGQNNYLWMQMINVGTSGKGFFYSVEVADMKELRSVSYKGPVFPLHATINDNQDCLIVSDSLLGTLKRDLILHVKISIWKKP